MNFNKILDLRKGANHPLAFLYSEIYDSCIIDALIEHGRSQPGFSLKENSPFVIAAKIALENQGMEEKAIIYRLQKIFAQYYDVFRPKNAMEFLGFEMMQNQQLLNEPPWGSVFPWRFRSIESYKGAYEKMALIENKSLGIDKGIEDGWLFCGPCSEMKAFIEAKRMFYVISQIKQNGYERSDDNDGDAKATALVDSSGEWRWLLTGGNHRASAASALGYKTIPIRVNLVICREQVGFWPHVQDGLYTKIEALNFFDSIFNANVPPLAKDWYIK